MPAEPRPTRVLVVDDQRFVADSLALILKGWGYEARAVYSGEEAAQVALEWTPHAVVTDVMMGKMDGVALAIYLAHALPTCRVLLMSGNNATEQLLEESRQRGHDFPILAKPFHPDSIREFLGPLGPIGNA
jgi:CheY-like chemotaxis protein